MKNKIYILVLGTLFFLSFGMLAEDNVDLFNQPKTYSDSCGVRQILITKHILNNQEQSFVGNIIEYWNIAKQIFHRDYYEAIVNATEQIPSELTYPVPINYSENARKAVNGGPQTLTSSLIQAGQGFLELKAEHIYVNKDLAISQFGESLFNSELEIISELVGTDNITYFDGELKQEDFNNNGSYFMILINGCHWIGTTYNNTYNSLDHAPKSFDYEDVNSYPSVIIQWKKQEKDNSGFLGAAPGNASTASESEGTL